MSEDVFNMAAAWPLAWAILWALTAVPVGYLYLFVIASVRARFIPPSAHPSCRFAIAIPAHDEETVIGETVARLRRLDYPAELFDVHVVADHCTDATAQVARASGAIVHERREGPRGGKAPALSWLLPQILDPQPGNASARPCDAVVVFDADTQVMPDFLRHMNARLRDGDRAIQGKHRISNPDDGWFPALTSAIFLANNRYLNQGRVNLGCSATNMGDSICIASDLLREVGWGEGLMEDYDLRLSLLLRGVRIAFEPGAVGLGEAPVSLAAAQAQRQRWLIGTVDSTRRRLPDMLRAMRVRPSRALMDGIAQMVLPAYSTVLLFTVAALGLQASVAILGGPTSGPAVSVLWFTLFALLLFYPIPALVLERASRRAYLATLAGPFFVVWRSWLAIVSRFGRKQVTWIRTPRRSAPHK